MSASVLSCFKNSRSNRSADVPAIVVLWLLRLLVPLGAHRQIISAEGFRNEAVARAVGLGHHINEASVATDETDELEFLELDDDESDKSCASLDKKVILAELRRRHVAAERKCSGAELPQPLRKNIDRLARLVGLSKSDELILGLVALSRGERLIDDVLDWIGVLPTTRLFRLLADMLALPEEEVRQSLSPNGVLARSGLVTVERNMAATFSDKVSPLSERFADLICSADADPVTLIRSTVQLARSPDLSLDDYGHLERPLSILRPFLRKACATGRVGVNVFLHGAPGTGKSQLSRVLALEVGCELFEVAGEDSDGDAIQGEARLRALRAAQCFFAKQRALIAFDEAEDVFQDGSNLFGPKSTAQTRKGWINRMLEENPVPVLWLSNSIGDMDPAFIRRFDMVVEVPVPPRQQRERIIRAVCGDLVDARGVSRLAEAEHLAPAVVARAASVVQSIRDEIEAPTAAAAVEQLIFDTLRAQGYRTPPREDPNRLPDTYDPAFIRADADLAAIAAGLIAAKGGRLCLYGPPGSGKTAFGRWLAGQAGQPLHALRCSDLISMWLGESEKNIARAFRKAEREGAILMIDEVDGFLQDRRDARHSWEVTQVNELLTQMESFAGIFIASTNLMQGLDQASLRRFDLKVKFDFLGKDQAWALLQRTCTVLELPAPEEAAHKSVDRLSKLTPGDFAAVCRQHRFRPVGSVVAFVAALGAECAIKEHSSAAIGFV